MDNEIYLSMQTTITNPNCTVMRQLAKEYRPTPTVCVEV